MSHHCCDWEEDVYINERILPSHCETCACPRSELRVRRQISRPFCRTVPSRRISCCYLPDVAYSCCPCNDTMPCDLCLCYECRKIRGRSEASIRKKERVEFENFKYSLLETWFSRFDSDGDGFLDLVDLESLLKYLGAKMGKSYTKKILKTCDRDSDGRLSFPEFVHLWQRAAHHDEDFVKRTGCPDLSHIVKKYKLFSDYRPCSCHNYHCKHVTTATEHPVSKVKCKCGQKDKIIPFIKHEDQVHRPPKKPKAKGVPEDLDKLPTMSMNRDNIV